MDVVAAAEGTDAAVAALTDGSLATGEGDGGSLLPPYADQPCPYVFVIFAAGIESLCDGKFLGSVVQNV